MAVRSFVQGRGDAPACSEDGVAPEADLDSSGRLLRVAVAQGPGHDHASDLQGGVEGKLPQADLGLRALRQDLGAPRLVCELDEHQVTQKATAHQPPGEQDLQALVVRAQFTTFMGPEALDVWAGGMGRGDHGSGLRVHGRPEGLGPRR